MAHNAHPAEAPGGDKIDEYVLEDILEDLQHFAATQIQRVFRGYLGRRHIAAVRERLLREEAGISTPDPLQPYHTAARRIQHAWRCYCNRKVFEFYRELITSRQAADPRELLRGINPREAQLVEPAAGLHVRLRLGGSMFPPLVFYKIFTHRPVTDINAFCPRDYAAEALADRPGKPGAGAAAGAAGVVQQSKPPISGGSSSRRQKQLLGDFQLEEGLRQYFKRDGSVGHRPQRGWYERWENNGWRPVAERLLLPEGPVAAVSRQQGQRSFHHSPTVRREERARRAKQRRREWLLKLHRHGMLAAAQGLSEQQLEQLLERQERRQEQLEQPEQLKQQRLLASGWADSGAGSSTTLAFEQQGGPHAVEGTVAADCRTADIGGDADLLQWTAGLDFDAYVAGWSSLACTLPSEVDAAAAGAAAAAAAGRAGGSCVFAQQVPVGST